MLLITQTRDLAAKGHIANVQVRPEVLLLLDSRRKLTTVVRSLAVRRSLVSNDPRILS